MRTDNEEAGAPSGSVIRRTLVRAVLLPLIVMAVLCAVLVWQVQNLIEHARWVEHTQEVIGHIYQAQTLLLEQETGARAYLLTGDKAFLEPYERGTRELPDGFQQLRRLIDDNPEQQVRLDALRKKSDAWTVLMAAAIAAVPANPPSTGAVSPSFLEERRATKRMMDEMRATTADMIAAERKLLAVRRDQAAQSANKLLWAGGILLLLVGVLLAILVRRWILFVTHTYRVALRESEASARREHEARTAAEALAEDIAEQAKEMERKYLEVRDVRAHTEARPAEQGAG